MSGALNAKTSGQALAIALRLGVNILGHCENPMNDARKLLEHAAGVESGRLPLLDVEDFDEALMTRYTEFLYRRAEGEPVSIIVGFRAFWKQVFHITGDVLDPRPETEVLVEAALEEPFSNVLDLGTGSGCILLSLLDERPEAQGIGTDLSGAALDVAQRNASRLDVRAEFVLSNWFANVQGSFDLIVSNPPYIAATEMPALQRELTFEPRMALTDEADGLSAYRSICARAPEFLLPNGRLIVEIGHRQGPQVAQLMADAGLQEVAILPDLDGRDRVVSARKPA